jgi:hypothetical protein
MGDDYTIVSAQQKEQLIEKVKILCGLGWYPVGAAFVAQDEWHQTMSKYNNDADDDSDDGDQPSQPIVPPSGGIFILAA